MFKKAIRKNVYTKIAVIGPSGSGKTMSSIRLAKGLGDKVALVDSENDSASMYAHLDFDVAPITEPLMLPIPPNITIKSIVIDSNTVKLEGSMNVI